MPTTSSFKLERMPGVAKIVWDHPPLNLLGMDAIDELDSILTGLEGDAEVRVILLVSALPKIFSAGVDIKAMAGLGTAEEVLRVVRKGTALLRKLEASEKLTVAAIRGRCIGGGMELAMAFDLRIAARSAVFAQPEIRLGIIPGFGGTQRLPRLVGESAARKWILTGDPVPAREFFRAGGVDYLESDWGFQKKAERFSERMSRASAMAIGAAKKALKAARERGGRPGEEIESELFSGLTGTRDREEGLRAFIEKRTPRFNKTEKGLL